jgi:hypothetical protein
MSKHDDAPERKLAGDSRGSGFSGNATTLPDLIPKHIRERLARNGIRTADDWLALGRKRKEIFGITAATVAKVDIAVTLAKRFGPR